MADESNCVDTRNERGNVELPKITRLYSRMNSNKSQLRGWFTNVIDEKSAFSTTPNEKTVYLEFPDGMTNTPNNDYILRLNNSINGTKQAANDCY